MKNFLKYFIVLFIVFNFGFGIFNISNTLPTVNAVENKTLCFWDVSARECVKARDECNSGMFSFPCSQYTEDQCPNNWRSCTTGDSSSTEPSGSSVCVWSDISTECGSGACGNDEVAQIAVTCPGNPDKVGSVHCAKSSLCGAIAQSSTSGGSFALPNPLSTDTFEGFVTGLIRALTVIAAPILVLMVIWGGFLFITAGANPSNAKKAKDVIKYAVIGFAIIAFAWVIILIFRGIL